MPGVSRSQLTFRAGVRLVALGEKLSTSTALPVTDKNLDRLLNSIYGSIPALQMDLDRVTASCHEAKGMYLNYPRLRERLLDAGDEVERLARQLESLKLTIAAKVQFPNTTGLDDIAAGMLVLGQQLKLIDFTPTKSDGEAIPSHSAPGRMGSTGTNLSDPDDSL